MTVSPDRAISCAPPYILLRQFVKECHTHLKVRGQTHLKVRRHTHLKVSQTHLKVRGQTHLKVRGQTHLKVRGQTNLKVRSHTHLKVRGQTNLKVSQTHLKVKSQTHLKVRRHTHLKVRRHTHLWGGFLSPVIISHLPPVLQGVVTDASPQTVAPSSQEVSAQQQQIQVDGGADHVPAYSYQSK
ncbi:RNA-binding motif, single-stranded-interacting protein 3 [Takifugu flavidus]|uniref:RNA-binding motif, single-stranded-interacting protein 3 n=1 Tax=Takifugu flavidus TaxID=433684 RepID=A0A5C6NEU4_9TELE|nr:RNA-binding motif, single-stranded-interacting protein 3 [Takifugu flavidus]